jgi:hypothetical protein
MSNPLLDSCLAIEKAAETNVETVALVRPEARLESLAKYVYGRKFKFTEPADLGIVCGSPHPGMGSFLTEAKFRAAGVNFRKLSLPQDQFKSNMIGLVRAAELGSVIFLGTFRSTKHDATPRFYKDMAQILSDFYNRRIVVTSLFLTSTRLQAVKGYLHDGGTIDELLKTRSCHSDKSVSHCGVCVGCFRRFKLFQALDVATDFETHPCNGPNWVKFHKEESDA